MSETLEALPEGITVIKVGGSLARAPGLADRLEILERVTRGSPSVIVPGGGPFVDTVRDQADRHGLDEHLAHWMAVLAMDQYAHLLTSAIGGHLARGPRRIATILDAGGVPVLAPYDWLRREDPLPHDWSVTSDSIAAWVAGRLAARRLVLLKSTPGRSGVDAYFRTALPAGLQWEVVTPDGPAPTS